MGVPLSLIARKEPSIANRPITLAQCRLSAPSTNPLFQLWSPGHVLLRQARHGTLAPGCGKACYPRTSKSRVSQITLTCQSTRRGLPKPSNPAVCFSCPVLVSDRPCIGTDHTPFSCVKPGY
ncbi:hypothetical protein VTI74DRAFT_10387 [Chaetomium olivicolor]